MRHERDVVDADGSVFGPSGVLPPLNPRINRSFIVERVWEER